MPGTPEQKDFREIQYTFTRHIRDPLNEPAPPDIEERRMEIYRGLLFRNVEDFIAGSFPVLRKITPDDRWHDMIRDYFKRHQAHTPLFPKMPQEFLQYLEQEREDKNDPAFTQELAHYEWIELAVSMDTREINWNKIDPAGDLLDGVPVLSPLVFPLRYRYPVHKISKNYMPEEPPEQPTYLVVYRDRADKVGFIELNPVSARLLELLQQNSDKTGRELLQLIAGELGHPEPDVVIKGGTEILQNLHSKDILPGTRKK